MDATITFTAPTEVCMPDEDGCYPTALTHILPAGTYEIIEEDYDFFIIMDEPDGCNWMYMKD